MSAILAMPDPQVLLTLLILVGAIGFYARGRYPIDLISFGLLVVLVVAFQLLPVVDPVTGANRLDAPRLVSGFANGALLTVVCLLVVGEGVTRTGALSVVAQLIQATAMGSWRMALALSLAVVAVASAFVNNTPIVVIFIPILLSVASEMDISPSKLMMPLSFASILGGTCTLIGTSTNILVAEYMSQTGVAQLDMFSFSALGVILLGVGLVYLVFVAPALLPATRNPRESDLTGAGRNRFTAQLQVLADSPLVGRPLAEVVADGLEKVEVSQLIRGELVNYRPPFDPALVIKPGDTLILMGVAKELKKAEWDSRSTLAPYIPGTRLATPQEAKKAMLAEIVIPHESNLIGQTLSQVRFRDRFQVAPIGIRRHSRGILGRITEEPLQAGDLLLIQGGGEHIDALTRNPEVLLYWGVHESVIHAPKAPVAAAILGVVVGLAAFHVASMLVLSVAGAFLMLATRCLSLRQAYRAISPQVVLLIAATLALGDAMQETGAAAWLARSFITLTMGHDPWLIMSLFGLLVTALTNVISNNATAILFAPVAMGMAETLGVSPMPFLMAVVFGANAAFASPIGYKTNLLVLSVGAYRFNDFLKAGLLLNLLAWLLVSLLIPFFWPF